MEQTISPQINHSDNTLRSCLLRTGELPSGIITSTHFRRSSESEETTNDIHNQFILRPNDAPHPIVINHSENENTNIRERVPSFSSQISQISHITDDDDNKSGSLHVLSDEQLNHLAYEYHSYSSEVSFSTGTNSRSPNLLSDSLLY